MKSVWYSYVVAAEAVGDLEVGEEGQGGLTIGHGVAITDRILIMVLTIDLGVTD
jgi:hypothetical protein